MLKSQKTLLDVSRRVLREKLPSNTFEEATLPLDPLQYREVEAQMNLPEKLSKKTDIPDMLKCSALNMLSEEYPENEWLRVFTDGSQKDGTGAEAGVFSVCRSWTTQ